MGTSFVENKNFGYWAKDAFLEGLLFLLVREFKKIKDKDEWLTKVMDDWSISATAGYMGCVPSNLDEFFDTPSRLNLLRMKLDKIIMELETNEQFLTLDDLNGNNIGGTPEWVGVNTQGFQNCAQLMLNLVNGKLKTDPSSPVDYWSF